MKQITLLLTALILSASCFAQFHRITNVRQTWLNQPSYTTGGFSEVGLNQTTGQVEITTKGITTVESDSARNYNYAGSKLVNIKFGTRDTINLVTANYPTNLVTKFIVTKSGADTVVFIPSAGTINGATSQTLTGTNAAQSIWFDGTNYWITK